MMTIRSLFAAAAIAAAVSAPAARCAAQDAAIAAGERVAPGLVRWHDDFDAARAAAATSGRPVLLFQLLGRLDDEFC